MKKLLCVIIAVAAMLTVRAQGPEAAATPMSTERDYHIENGEVKTAGNVTFTEGTSELTPASEQALKKIKKYLDDASHITLLRVEGHVDGESGNNQTLSESRALAVCHWLVSKGIDCKRLIPVGFANTKRISESNVVNTRIAFVNAALRGHAIGGMPVDGGGKVAGNPCKE